MTLTKEVQSIATGLEADNHHIRELNMDSGCDPENEDAYESARMQYSAYLISLLREHIDLRWKAHPKDKVLGIEVQREYKQDASG